jgi:hypothetical protein
MVDSDHQGKPRVKVETISADDQYCAVLMVKNEDELAYDILQHVVYAGIFNTRRCEVALRLMTVGEFGSPR